MEPTTSPLVAERAKRNDAPVNNETSSPTADTQKEFRDINTSTSGNIEVVTPDHEQKQVSLSHPDNAQKQVHIDQHGGSGNIEVNHKPPVYRKFQVEKSTALGLILPQNLQLTIYNVTNGSYFPSYLTTNMHWVELMTALPAVFSLYPVSNTGVSGEDTGRIVKFCPKGWQGVTGLKAELETAINGTAGATSERKWTITRSGWSRQHRMEEVVTGNELVSSPNSRYFVWKGSIEVVDLLDDEGPRCKGNLKLESLAGNTLLAAWKQRRDDRIMGSITIFEAAKDVLPVEVIVASCISVVMSERASGVNFFGGKKK
ncbi:hypothetical protein AJ79_01601 [Helicocarpus griseus UAMH5409]|uniref:Tubby C-terminal domain-containing protein n=1 Tax=Helicocarpus griseus UAMH5409 TaxID=1447875 RepID=A0A2B7Y749_9EURO|nr:hypothetical protein AJ79_01601 [Helicocarpus griseus UAMH5409]